MYNDYPELIIENNISEKIAGCSMPIKQFGPKKFPVYLGVPCIGKAISIFICYFRVRKIRRRKIRCRKNRRRKIRRKSFLPY